MKKNKQIEVINIQRIISDLNNSYYIIQNWLRNRNTIEFHGICEKLKASDFNSIEFDGFECVTKYHGLKLMASDIKEIYLDLNPDNNTIISGFFIREQLL